MNIKYTNDSDVSVSRASTTMRYAVIGFAIGYMLLWAGCGGCSASAIRPEKDIALYAMGGGLFAILGAVLGAVVGSVRK